MNKLQIKLDLTDFKNKLKKTNKNLLIYNIKIQTMTHLSQLILFKVPFLHN